MSGLPQPRADWALFLDFDGTLVEIAPTPGSVRVPESLAPLLRALRAALGGAVAIVTGRPVARLTSVIQSTSRLRSSGLPLSIPGAASTTPRPSLPSALVMPINSSEVANVPGTGSPPLVR